MKANTSKFHILGNEKDGRNIRIEDMKIKNSEHEKIKLIQN